MSAPMAAVENAFAPEGSNSSAHIQDVVEDSSRSSDPDPVKLAAKYKAEREKRNNLRPSGLGQYQKITGNAKYANYLDDPYADPNASEIKPVTKKVQVCILGGGFGGLQIAGRLSEAGFKDVLIVEKASDFGGTWYWNRYPGAQCDIESYIYTPLLEELNYIPKEKYSYQPELFQHAKNIGKHYGLYEKVLFSRTVPALRWDDKTSLWKVETNRGDNITAQFVVTCGGPLSSPKFPGVPGVETFKGHSFHTCRWDYGYTGGSTLGNLENLKDKRVGIIGTGATAVQVVPHLGASSKELFVFQRTPSSIDKRGNRPTDQVWAKSLKPGWQQARMDNFNTLISGEKVDEDLIQDGWTDILKSLAGFFGNGADDSMDPAALAAKMQMADYKKMDSIRARVDSIVKDKKTAESLKPYYNQFCKRPCFHDQYLDTFNLPSVHLVDTEGKGVDAITEKGVVVDGKEIELDCLIYSTGFDWGGNYLEKTGLQIYGKNGLAITDKWVDGPLSMHGWAVNEFPNLFMVSVAGSGATPNYTHNMAAMTNHFVYVLNKLRESGLKQFEVSKEAEAEWDAAMVKGGKGRQQFLKDCTPGYYNDEGIIDDVTSRKNPYGGGAMAFLSILNKWKSDDRLQGLVCA